MDAVYSLVITSKHFATRPRRRRAADMCLFIFTHIDEAARGIGQCLGSIAKELPRLAESCGKQIGKDIVSCTRR